MKKISTKIALYKAAKQLEEMLSKEKGVTFFKTDTWISWAVEDVAKEFLRQKLEHAFNSEVIHSLFDECVEKAKQEFVNEFGNEVFEKALKESLKKKYLEELDARIGLSCHK